MTAVTAITGRGIHDLVGDVLDGLDITDVVYHDFEYTRPLVESIVTELSAHVGHGANLLVIGANSLLAETIRSLGFRLTLWRFGENLLTPDLEQHISATVTPEMLAGGPLPQPDATFDAIVLARVFEHVPADPDDVLRRLRRALARDGVIVSASRNLGALHVRTRALLGKSFLPGTRPPEILFSMNWPDLQVRRYYYRHELVASARLSGLVVSSSAYAQGQKAFSGAESFGIRSWLVRKAKHAIKRAVPALRDFVIVTLRRPTAQEIRWGLVAANEVDADVSSEAERPFVSVVLPTKDRSAMLRDSLSGLFAQTYPASRFEVLIVDDGSRDDTPTVVAAAAASAPFAIRHLRTAGVGAIAARNLGMREAHGEIVAHLDDDCRPIPEWMDEAVRGFTTDVAVVGGPLHLKPEQSVPFFSFAPTYLREAGMYPTANVFYLREPALAAGGFDTSFGGNVAGRPVTGWDSDMAWRLIRAGYRARFREGALVHQEVFRLSPRQWLLDSWRVVTLPIAVKRVPELARHLMFGRVFASRLNFYFDLFLIGAIAAAASRTALPALLCLPWLAWCGNFFLHQRSPAQWPKLVVKLALMNVKWAAMLAALVVGSVRARRVLI